MAWNWRGILVDTLGFVLVEILFWLVVSLSTVLKNIVSLYTRLKQHKIFALTDVDLWTAVPDMLEARI